MTSPSVPVGPGPRPPYGPTGPGGPTPPVQPSPHGVGYTAQVPPPSQPTPPPPYGPGSGPVGGPGAPPGPGGPSGGGSAGGPYSAGSAQPQPFTQPSAQPQPMPSAVPGPAPGTAAPAGQRVGAAATLLDLGMSRRSDPSLVRLVYPLAVAGGVVVWLGPVITMFALAVTFGGGSLVVAAVLTLVLGWIPALALVGTARLTCETWLRGR